MLKMPVFFNFPLEMPRLHHLPRLVTISPNRLLQLACCGYIRLTGGYVSMITRCNFLLLKGAVESSFHEHHSHEHRHPTVITYRKYCDHNIQHFNEALRAYELIAAANTKYSFSKLHSVLIELSELSSNLPLLLKITPSFFNAIWNYFKTVIL